MPIFMFGGGYGAFAPAMLVYRENTIPNAYKCTICTFMHWGVATDSLVQPCWFLKPVQGYLLPGTLVVKVRHKQPTVRKYKVNPPSTKCKWVFKRHKIYGTLLDKTIILLFTNDMAIC